MPLIKTDEQLFDIRLLERHLTKGQITQKDYDAYLKNMDSVEDNADYVTADLIFDELKTEEPLEDPDAEDEMEAENEAEAETETESDTEEIED
jgi:hypothetical protein